MNCSTWIERLRKLSAKEIRRASIDQYQYKRAMAVRKLKSFSEAARQLGSDRGNLQRTVHRVVVRGESGECPRENIRTRRKRPRRKKNRNRIRHSPAVRWRVFSKHNFCCHYCGQRAGDVALELDHKVPLSEGGADREDNLVTSCRDCNLGRRYQ